MWTTLLTTAIELVKVSSTQLNHFAVSTPDIGEDSDVTSAGKGDICPRAQYFGGPKLGRNVTYNDHEMSNVSGC